MIRRTGERNVHGRSTGETDNGRFAIDQATTLAQAVEDTVTKVTSRSPDEAPAWAVPQRRPRRASQGAPPDTRVEGRAHGCPAGAVP
ncbi:hypothetical protein [Streptomyces sp. NPDC001135]